MKNLKKPEWHEQYARELEGDLQPLRPGSETIDEVAIHEPERPERAAASRACRSARPVEGSKR
jgi:hypothetical protein